MRTLSKDEVNEVSGGWFWIVARILAPTIFNMVAYAITKKHRNEPVTGTGLAIAGSSGVLSGGVSVGLGAAAGGGAFGAALWAPTTVTINATGSAIAKEH
jgi:hypothetical protein